MSEKPLKYDEWVANRCPYCLGPLPCGHSFDHPAGGKMHIYSTAYRASDIWVALGLSEPKSKKDKGWSPADDALLEDWLSE